ncbi:hypothetical protein AVEN_214385-1 [Araneus ventricosus]|uniref:Uncharacterized protein n=1 Tax=Araneus ventricosus TaxID=182803 RepID=A0A4Y2HP00_ARAVE|nr:hypothetical protein AVEN_214385-1 [Araneus ventricosus]
MTLPQSIPMEVFNEEVETFASYLDRLKMFFTKNNVPNDKKVPTMITLLSAKTYALLKNLLEPEKPKDKSFREMTAILEKQLNQKPLVFSKLSNSQAESSRRGDCGGVLCPGEETFN